MVKLWELGCNKVIFLRENTFLPESISRDVGRSGEVPGVVGEVWGSEIMRFLMENHQK